MGAYTSYVNENLKVLLLSQSLRSAPYLFLFYLFFYMLVGILLASHIYISRYCNNFVFHIDSCGLEIFMSIQRSLNIYLSNDRQLGSRQEFIAHAGKHVNTNVPSKDLTIEWLLSRQKLNGQRLFRSSDKIFPTG